MKKTPPDERKHLHTRYYHEPPDRKSLVQCEQHGADHAAYRWGPQLDPRWSDEQRAAYWRGFNGS